MSRWEELKMLLLALAISVALATAGALLAIGMAHLLEAATNEKAQNHDGASLCFLRLPGLGDRKAAHGSKLRRPCAHSVKSKPRLGRGSTEAGFGARYAASSRSFHPEQTA